jgi:preprotein translocase subunit SecF
MNKLKISKMKVTLKKISLLLAIVSIVIACGDSQSKKVDKAEIQKITREEIAQSTLSDSEIKTLLNGYLEIKDALVETNGRAASFAAENLSFELRESQDEVLQKMMIEIKGIEGTEETEGQRVRFEVLSQHLYELLKARPLSGQELYQQYCPMAFDNTGAYWLSTEEKIYNPYFGDKMLRCGKVLEVIQ